MLNVFTVTNRGRTGLVISKAVLYF